MAQQFNIPGIGGINPGTLVVDVDPTAVALRRAELEEKLQRPGLERARLDLDRQQAQRAYEQMVQSGQIEKSRLGEETRFHTGTLEESKLSRLAQVANEQSKLAEETRFHTGTLAESKADREMRQAAESAKTKASVLGDIMGHYLPLEGQPGYPSGSIARTATEFGYPELEKSIAGRKTEDIQTRAKTLVPEFSKYTPEQRTTQLAGLPEETRAALTPMLPAAPAATAAPTGPPASFGAMMGQTLRTLGQRRPLPPREQALSIARPQAEDFWNTLFGRPRKPVAQAPTYARGFNP